LANKRKMKCPNGHTVKISGTVGNYHFNCGVCGLKGRIPRLPGPKARITKRYLP